MAKLDEIPQEIFNDIIGFVKADNDDSNDFKTSREKWRVLRTLRGLNRAMKDKATPAAFEYAISWLSERSLNDLDQLSNQPEL